MRRIIVICTLLEIAFISLLIYIFKDNSCDGAVETTPVTIERVNTTPWEIEEPIYIYEWLTNEM